MFWRVLGSASTFREVLRLSFDDSMPVLGGLASTTTRFWKSSWSLKAPGRWIAISRSPTLPLKGLYNTKSIFFWSRMNSKSNQSIKKEEGLFLWSWIVVKLYERCRVGRCCALIVVEMEEVEGSDRSNLRLTGPTRGHSSR